ncbi:hypothetical protein [Embleya hyalina]|uniref:Uncharacterized protein n=1 Tax=Embleya hyalina TaxID=516124 RepID=A0A401YE66_9ACTN|nr:hypothetical protein [Embleya hyalina]GCD92894.1 hypothetical protein EHYA_00537 [Embleya hyalina]
MTLLIAGISAPLGGFVTGPDPGPGSGPGTDTCGGAPRPPVRRSMLSTSTATHPTHDVSR